MVVTYLILLYGKGIEIMSFYNKVCCEQPYSI